MDKETELIQLHSDIALLQTEQAFVLGKVKALSEHAQWLERQWNDRRSRIAEIENAKAARAKTEERNAK